jgi:hypothetical protein
VDLASSAGAKRYDILTPLDLLAGRRCSCIAVRPFATCQLQHLHLVQCRDRLEVEAVQAFDGEELGGLDPSFDHPPFAVDHLQFDQTGKELDMIQPLLPPIGAPACYILAERSAAAGT